MEPNRERTYWICQLSGWTVFALSGVAMTAAFSAFSWELLASRIAVSAIGLTETHILRSIIRRRKWLGFPLKSLIPRLIIAAVVMAAIWQLLTMAMIITIFRVRFEPGTTLGINITMMFTWATAMIGWAAIYFGVHYFENLKQSEVEKWRLEAAVKDAELRAFKSQMNPHFIFNCLNNLRALIVEDPKRAQDVVTQLASILRYSLQSSNTETVTLERELQTVSDYLALEAIRLEDRLQVKMDIASESLDAMVPTMLVQTLVENGIKYGVSRLPGGGEIMVMSQVVDSTLQIQVTNSGQFGEAGNSTGVGVKNAIERLKLLFGEAASLTIASQSRDRVTAEVRIPLANHKS